MCGWDAKQGWIRNTQVEGFEASGKVLFPRVSHNVVGVFQYIHPWRSLVERYEKKS